MGFVSVALRTGQFMLVAAAGAGRLGRLAPAPELAEPWWLPNGGQALLNVVSAFLTRMFFVTARRGARCAVRQTGAAWGALCCEANQDMQAHAPTYAWSQPAVPTTSC